MTEFTGLDLEKTFKDHYHEVLTVLEEVFLHIFEGINARCAAELKAVRRGAAANASVVVLNTTAGDAEMDVEDAAAHEMRHALRIEEGRAAAQAEAAPACARIGPSTSSSLGNVVLFSMRTSGARSGSRA